jgi:hypothetical protein
MSHPVGADDQRFVTDTLLKATVIAQQIFKKEDPSIVFTIYELLVSRAHCRSEHLVCQECGEELAADDDDDDDD